MKLSVVNEDTQFNRAMRSYETREYKIGTARLTADEERALRKCAREYGLTVPGMVALIVSYYFGDGKNHFGCEYCDLWGGRCNMPLPGEQTTMPTT